MIIEIKRKYKKGATIGTLSIDGCQKCVTLERPWKKNEARVSCIPEGTYEIELKHYGRWHKQWQEQDWYKGVLILKDTEPRSEILIHTANYSRQLNGCIAPGVTEGVDKDGTPCVWRSKAALLEIYPIIVNAIETGQSVEIVLTK